MLHIESYIEQFEGKRIAVSVHDLETRIEININPDEPFHPASTIKVPIMLSVFHQAGMGGFSLDDQLAIHNQFTSLADGSIFSLDIKDDSDKSLYGRLGGSESIRELTRLMIVRSSNLATNLLIDLVSAESANRFLSQLGVSGVTVLRGVEDNAAFRAGLNNSATAHGLTGIMRLLAEGKVISTDSSIEMIEFLLEQEFNESLPASLPESVKVAHKTGWTGENYHDTGIVFPPHRQPYAITIMTRGFPEDDESQAHACMAELSRRVYDELILQAR